MPLIFMDDSHDRFLMDIRHATLLITILIINQGQEKKKETFWIICRNLKITMNYDPSN